MKRFVGIEPEEAWPYVVAVFFVIGLMIFNYFNPIPYFQSKYDIYGTTYDNQSVYCWCPFNRAFNCSGGYIIGSELNCSNYNSDTLSKIIRRSI